MGTLGGEGGGYTGVLDSQRGHDDTSRDWRKTVEMLGCRGDGGVGDILVTAAVAGWADVTAAAGRVG